MTLDLIRSGLIEAKAPVCDVNVVTHPVHQLATAVIEIPAPLLVAARFTIRRLRRRPEPAIIVERCRRRSERRFVRQLSVVERPARQFDFDTPHLPNTPVANQFASLMKLRLRSLPASGLPNAVMLAHGFADFQAFREIVRERFFTVDILARARR